MDCDYDILIVGGGMVGATMAYALSPLPLRIGVIEAVPFKSDNQLSYDDRAIALHASHRTNLVDISKDFDVGVKNYAALYLRTPMFRQYFG